MTYLISVFSVYTKLETLSNRLLLTCHSTTVIYKTRVRSLIFRLAPLAYHRRILFTDFFSQSQFYLPETESPEKRLSKRYSPFKSPLSGYLWSYKKMDCNNPELGSGLWRVKYHVWRSLARVIKKQKNRRITRLLLTCNFVTVIYKARAKSWFCLSLSLILIIEDHIYRLFFIVSIIRLPPIFLYCVFSSILHKPLFNSTKFTLQLFRIF